MANGAPRGRIRGRDTSGLGAQAKAPSWPGRGSSVTRGSRRCRWLLLRSIVCFIRIDRDSHRCSSGPNRSSGRTNNPRSDVGAGSYPCTGVAVAVGQRRTSTRPPR